MGNHRQKLIHNSTVGRHSLITLSGSLASQVYSRMGVGVLNPEYNLHVSGSTYVLGYLGVGLGAAPPLYHLHAQESRSSNYIAYIQNNSNNSAHGVYIGSNGTGAGSYLLNVKNFLTITGEGKVGINTLSPAETFHISGSQRITQASSNTLGAGLEIWRYDASEATYHWMDGSGDYHVDNATNGSRHIIFNDGGVGEVRVGAGIRLNATGNRLGRTDNTGYNTMYGGGAYNTGTGVITYGNAHATEPNVIRFTRSGFVESMRIDTSGNIGVNNSNPSHQVDLLGQNSRRIHLQNAYIGFHNPNYTSGAQNWGWGAFGASNEDGVFLRRYISDSYPFASPYNDLLQVHSSGMLTFESYGLNTIFGDGTGRALGADADGDLVELDMYKKSSSLTVLETTTTTSGSLYVSSFQEPVDTPINLQANTAFGPWVMSATSYKVGIVEGGTTLTLRDNPLNGVSGSSVIWEQTYNTPGVYTVTPSVTGSILHSNGRPIGMYVNGRADLIQPFQLAGTKFVDYITRYSPKIYYIYPPDGGVRVDYYAIAGSHTTYPDTANSASSHFIKPGEWFNFTGITSDAHTARFNCSGNVIITSYNAAGDQHILYPCSKEVISGEETAPNTMAFLSTGTVLSNGKYYYSFNDLVQTQINGDGAGYNCLQGLPVSMMKNTYIIAHTLQNLQLTSIYKGTITISYYSGGVWSLKEVVSINGSIEAPDRVDLGTGDSAGGSAYLNADLIIVHGTVPFVCRTNDLANVEYYPLGYRTAHRHLYY